MKTLFTTFYYDYDDSHYYEKCAIRLKKQIEGMGGRIIVHSPKLEGDYNLNTLFKPSIILKTLLETKEDLIWIDADCYINEMPREMDNISYDMGAVTRIHDNKTPHSALLFFKFNNIVIDFVTEWKRRCEEKIVSQKLGEKYMGGDHHILIETLRDKCKEVKCAMFPTNIACSVNKNVKVRIGISPGGQKGI